VQAAGYHCKKLIRRIMQVRAAAKLLLKQPECVGYWERRNLRRHFKPSWAEKQ
jgi:hypothetical protein